MMTNTSNLHQVLIELLKTIFVSSSQRLESYRQCAKRRSFELQQEWELIISKFSVTRVNFE